MADMVNEIKKWLKVMRLSPRYAHEAKVKVEMYVRLAALAAADDQQAVVCWWAS